MILVELGGVSPSGRSKIRQHFQQNSLSEISGLTKGELRKLEKSIKPGDKIAIAVGSRGIDNQEIVIREVIDLIRSCDAVPFIIPAMGSHGGATAEGQEEILASYGFSESELGVPVRSSMDVVDIPCQGYQDLAFMDKFAYESDGVILINRIKPHTD